VRSEKEKKVRIEGKKGLKVDELTMELFGGSLLARI